MVALCGKNFGTTMTTLDRDTVMKLGRLARIGLDDDQADRVAGELGSVLDWIEQLQEVNIDGVTPMTSVLDARARLRDDRVADGENPEPVLANAPHELKGFYTVPKVIE